VDDWKGRNNCKGKKRCVVVFYKKTKKRTVGWEKKTGQVFLQLLQKRGKWGSSWDHKREEKLVVKWNEKEPWRKKG